MPHTKIARTAFAILAIRSSSLPKLFSRGERNLDQGLPPLLTQ
jgi:hypothetical protein